MTKGSDVLVNYSPRSRLATSRRRSPRPRRRARRVGRPRESSSPSARDISSARAALTRRTRPRSLRVASPSVIIGAFLVVVGVVLTAIPVAAGRAANALRFVPYSRDAAAVRWYRTMGVVIVVAGVVVMLTQ